MINQSSNREGKNKLQTDASTRGIGDVLTQRHENESECASKALSEQDSPALECHSVFVGVRLLLLFELTEE